MEKKHGFIFLSFGFLLLVMFVIYNYKDIFEAKKNNSSDSVKITGFNYDFVKSRDINKKTKILYLVKSELSIADDIDDYYKYYINSDGLFLTATIVSFNGTIKTYSANQYSVFKKGYEKDGQTISTNNIDCKYLCSRDKVLKSDGSVLIDSFRMYIQISPSELFELNYRLDNKELSEELINLVINNIIVNNDATYLIGNISGDENKLFLDFNLKNDEAIVVTLDGNKYEEIPTKYNSQRLTTVRNINNDAEVMLMIRYKRNNTSLKDDVDSFWYSVDSKKELMVNDKKFYEYSIGETKNYAYLMEDKALLIQALNGTIDINDFTNIKIKDVS